MHADYYQNILYPFQDKILNIIEGIPVEFYLTGGTALSRGYLHHRYSDDLDFFLNSAADFKAQVNLVIKAFTDLRYKIDIPVAEDGFTRVFAYEGENILKLDFVNDIAYRYGLPEKRAVFVRTDNLFNILSNKITAVIRYSPKDVVDIVYICKILPFSWKDVIDDAAKKDIWVNPINISEVLDKFPIQKLDEIIWVSDIPSSDWFKGCLNKVIADIISGEKNSLC